VTHSTPQGRITSSETQLPSFDPSVPNPARMWNYWLGGKDNFAGLVPISQWGLAGRIDATVGGLVGYCGMGWEP
jgi:hypothetical protein